MSIFFGRSNGYISGTVNAVREYLQLIASPLLDTFDHRRIQGMMPVFAAAIFAKGSPLQYIWGFLDGVFVPFCRPSLGGYNGVMQRSVYSGHKKCHGHNNQGLLTPDGIIAEMHGPLARCAFHCVVDGVLYYLYGDKGYRHGNPCLQVPFIGAGLTQQQQSYNTTMSAIRISVEHGFGKVKSLWAYIDYKKGMHLFGNPVCSYWQVAVLMTNCHTCLYGSQTGQYYEVPAPYLEDYLARAFF
jgi:nuclease HARBI1